MSFVPTDYKGLSELGMISAIGLVIGLVLNLSLLPCLIIVWSSKVKRHLMSFGSEKLINFVLNNQKKFLIIFFIIFIFTLLNFKNVKFDSDALNLKDQKLQSVKLAKELIEKNPTSDYVVSLIFDEKDFNSFGMSHPIFRNENVKSFFSFNNIISKYESDDLDYLKFLLSRDSFLKTDSNKNEITKFKLLLDQFIIKNFNPLSKNAYKLKQELINLEKERYSSLEIKNLLFEGFDDLIYFISSIDSIPDNVENLLPKSFKQRYISEDNLYRIEIFPSKDLSKPENLENFVKIIESYFPNATGMPIIQYNAGKVVSESFIKAFIISIIFLVIYLIFIFKKILYIIFCVGALVCAFILSIFFMIILNIDLNFANMIAIPLLFSLGVSYPLYLLRRFQEVGDVKKIYQTNTPSAIVYSGLTTIFSFGTLYISPHNGTSSMGLLLFLCLLNTLISCLILLPIALNVFKQKLVFK